MAESNRGKPGAGDAKAQDQLVSAFMADDGGCSSGDAGERDACGKRPERLRKGERAESP